VNGKPWRRFDRNLEVIELRGRMGRAVVVARYRP
jgi:hypothetical protein